MTEPRITISKAELIEALDLLWALEGGTVSQVVCVELIDKIFEPKKGIVTKNMIQVGEYCFADYADRTCLYVYKASGEGMALGKESLDKIWKEYL